MWHLELPEMKAEVVIVALWRVLSSSKCSETNSRSRKHKTSQTGKGHAVFCKFGPSGPLSLTRGKAPHPSDKVRDGILSEDTPTALLHLQEQGDKVDLDMPRP